ncbi:hypothetical protein R3W88_029274 [Solanum pinnatisectum]|uniref:Dephospho-CoA kinase n=1 Tax=Solanum pinnatisectum TaxID=50273 RepID=A0AAV9K6T5_9SOLN|nr:hypothetical protein R3W88_029274 [Solanum pinnatisectum]
MRIVGLTGGIASGKSTVSNLFKAHGIPVVDADFVACNILKEGTGGWKKVVAAFGEDILLDNGEVDRAKLGQIVFSDFEKRQLLNSSLILYFLFQLDTSCQIKRSRNIVLPLRFSHFRQNNVNKKETSGK